MNVRRLVCREILYRKLNVVLAVLSVAVAVGVLVAQVALLRAHDARTEEVLHDRQQEADRELARMEDDYRKYMKELGFNVLILPRWQDLARYWHDGYATATMPEENVSRLAATGTTLMRHLLPIVQQRIRWPEKEREVTLIGTRGEVPVAGRGEKEPMLQAVPPGKAVVGHRLAADLGLEPGATFVLRGMTFEVLEVRPRQGGVEDTTIWLSLTDAQGMLGLEGRIHAIEALKCHCASGDKQTIDAEIAALTQVISDALPDVQVVVRQNKVVLRAKARLKAQEVHEASIRKWEADRAELRRRREAFAAVLAPILIVGAAAWIGLLTMINVRERRAEIGILRAIGVRSRGILAVFLAKAVAVGLVGAVVGCVAGTAAGAVLAAREGNSAAGAVASPAVIAAALIAAPLVAALAALAPAMAAARCDPATVLRLE